MSNAVRVRQHARYPHLFMIETLTPLPDGKNKATIYSVANDRGLAETVASGLRDQLAAGGDV